MQPTKVRNMKRIFKNVNIFGLLNMLVVGLLVFIQSAFKSDHTAMQENIFQWHRCQ